MSANCQIMRANRPCERILTHYLNLNRKDINPRVLTQHQTSTGKIYHPEYAPPPHEPAPTVLSLLDLLVQSTNTDVVARTETGVAFG